MLAPSITRGLPRAKSLAGFYASVEAGNAASLFLAVLDDSLPFFFVGYERPVLFAVGGDLQLVGVRVGKINASFSRSDGVRLRRESRLG